MALTLTAFSLSIPNLPAKISAFNPFNFHPSSSSSSSSSSSWQHQFLQCRSTPTHADQFVYPNPIPDFADSETEKFKADLRKKLIESEGTFGDDLDDVVGTCATIFAEFLHKEYGGPGTLMVEPFTYMYVSLNEKKLPGSTLAARAALLWAQNHVDHDWEAWNQK